LQNHITRADDGANRTYIQYDDYAAPGAILGAPTHPEAQQKIVSDATLGPIALGANVALTIIIVTAMMIDGSQARTAIIVGSAYFMLSTFLFAGVTTGALTAVINGYQRERTERQRIAAHLALGTMALHWRLEVERNRVIGIPSASPLPGAGIPPAGSAERISPLSTFVEPYANEERAQAEAIAWAEKLYDRAAPGAPDGRKVQLAGAPEAIGRLRVRMIGSKRGGGSRDAGVWLLRQGVIRKVSGGYSLNVAQFPYRHYISALAPK